MCRSLAACLVAAGCLLAPAAHADFRAEYASAKGAAGPSLSRIEVGGGQMRMDTGNASVLVNAGSGQVMLLLHDKHEYMDVGKMAQSLSQMLESVPPQMRDMVKQRMAAHGAGGDVSYAPSGASLSVDGHACTVYRVDVGNQHASDVCLADIGAAGISAADQATVRKAFDALRDMAKAASAGLLASSSLNQIPAGKFPVQITRYENGKVVETAQLKAISTAALDAHDFKVPAGYAEREMPSLGARH